MAVMIIVLYCYTDDDIAFSKLFLFFPSNLILKQNICLSVVIFNTPRRMDGSCSPMWSESLVRSHISMNV